MNQPLVHPSIQATAGSKRALRVLDHSIPLHSGYTFRTRAILQQRRALGRETFHAFVERECNWTASVARCQAVYANL